MAGLGDTVSELMARAREASSPPGAGAALRAEADFGANPGALRMWLHVPEALPPHAPLVVVLHGCGQTAAGYAAGAGWIELADRYGFALLCPEQVRANNANLCFNWFEDADVRRGSGEAASIAQMVRHAVDTLRLDAGRVFVTGLSAGGAMAAVMLAAYPEVFAAGAVIAGLPYGVASGVNQAMGAMRRTPELSGKVWGDKVRAAAPPPASWPRISIWHGDADTTVTPAAAEALVLQWCDVHGVTPSPPASTPRTGRTHAAWRGPDGAVVVELHRLAGLGHGTPIDTRGEDACGRPAPWILEAGVSSSLEIARSWGLAEARRPAAAGRASSTPTGPASPAGAPGPSRPTNDVAETITRALRRAGLMR